MPVCPAGNGRSRERFSFAIYPSVSESTLHPRMDREQRFVGGMRTYLSRAPKHPLWSLGANASRPLAELVVDDEWIRLQLRYRPMRALVGGLIRPFEVRVHGARADPFGRTPATRGVLVRGTGSDGEATAIFWCSRERQRQVLDLLRQRGATVA